jgi:hypothetical protein
LSFSSRNSARRPNDMIAKQKNRSPAYPVHSLEKGVELISDIYRSNQFRPVPYHVLAASWGYSASSSNGQRTLAALKHFDLVSETKAGRERLIELTRLGKRIVLGRHATTADYFEALRTAALNPPVFRAMWDQWGENTPSNNEVTRFLVLDMNFNPNSAEAVLSNYRQTLGFSGLLKSAEERASAIKTVPPPVAREAVVHKFAPEPVDHLSPSVNKPSKKRIDINLSLIDSGVATLSLEIPLSETDFDLLLRLTEANLRAMKDVIIGGD